MTWGVLSLLRACLVQPLFNVDSREWECRLVELLNLDKDAYEDVGIIVFKNLGISVTGFEHSDDDDLAISAFSRVHWDEDLEAMRAYQL